MQLIRISVCGKIAAAEPGAFLVGGSTDQILCFRFSEEWQGIPEKTARFVFYGAGAPVVRDVLFAGETVAVPTVPGAYLAVAGVCAKGLATTPVRLPCLPGSGPASEPPTLAQQLTALVSARVTQQDQADLAHWLTAWQTSWARAARFVWSALGHAGS